MFDYSAIYFFSTVLVPYKRILKKAQIDQIVWSKKKHFIWLDARFLDDRLVYTMNIEQKVAYCVDIFRVWIK